MTYVYAVESGVYSDYSVHGIYSTKAKAKKVIDFASGSDMRIVRYELDSRLDKIEAGFKVWHVVMAADGTAEIVSECYDPGKYEVFDHLAWWPRSKAPAHKGTGTLDAVVGYVFARTEEHAVKIVNEFRVQEIAKRDRKRRGR